MRGRAVTLGIALLGLAAPAAAQDAQAAPEPRSAEDFIARAREVYTVREPGPEPCPEATAAEIIVCKPYAEDDSQRLPSPTERARAAGDKPPDPIPDAPYVLGLPECKVEVVCHRMGRAPPPIYIIDLEAIPEPLTPEQAARVFRAEDVPPEPASPAVASPAAAP